MGPPRTPVQGILMQELSTAHLSLKAAYAFGATKGLAEEADAIRNMVIEWDRTYTSSLRRAFVVELFERHGILEEFKKLYWTRGNTPEGEKRRRRYQRIKQQYEAFLAGNDAQDETDDPLEDEECANQEFAAEADLRDFLARNPSVIEPGLQLYEDDKRKGIEYPVDGGFIDLLTIDRKNEWVVVELKLSRGRNRALGQLLYYMAWVDQNLPRSKPCRGIIIAKEITPDLVLAVKRVPGVSLFRYELSVTVQPVAG